MSATVPVEVLTLDAQERLRTDYKAVLRDNVRLRKENAALHRLLQQMLANNLSANQDATVALAQIRREAKETR